MARWSYTGLALAILVVMLRSPLASLPFERDEGEYAYIAQRWVRGDLPYRDTFDQKPPAAFAFYALAFALGGERPVAVRRAVTLLTAATVVMLAMMGWTLLSPTAGTAAGLFAALLTIDPSWLGHAANTEILAIAPLTFGAWLARQAADRDSVAAGLGVGVLCGIALLCKPVVAPIVAFELATAAWGVGSRGMRLAAGVIGIALALVPVAVYFAAHGAWAPFLDATLWNNLAYASGLPLEAYTTNLRIRMGASLAALGPIYLLALAAPLWRDAMGSRRSVGWLALWLSAACPAIAAGGYFREHYFLLAAPPLALLAGAGLEATARLLAFPRIDARALVATAVALILVNAVAQAPWYFAPGPSTPKLRRLYGANPFPEAPTLGRWLAKRSVPDDRIFVYGSEPQLLFYSSLRSASRYFFVYPLTLPYGSALARQLEALAEIEAARPRWIVGVFVPSSLLEQPGTPPALKAELRALVERDYEVAAAVAFARTGAGRVVTGEAARERWLREPLWDGRMPWAAYIVWERKPHSAPEALDRSVLPQ
jgi:4-amino-4-deoxy-L-arabinose transferase-like glycosyltransferase